MLRLVLYGQVVHFRVLHTEASSPPASGAQRSAARDQTWADPLGFDRPVLHTPPSTTDMDPLAGPVA